ncbi:MAG: hypothetical protein RMJ84_09430 [Sandaracinaceae bacterium]|nr:hypothetical protein [Sandaracinaceae bacterium]
MGERVRTALVFAQFTLCFFLFSCGGAQPRAIDESRDVDPLALRPRRAAEIPLGLVGTSWRWIGASCTEGRLDLAARGYEATLRIEAEGNGLLLISNQLFGDVGCRRTVLQTFMPPPEPGELLTEEVARVTIPSDPACFGQPEPPRPGEIRRNGQNLEVLVQRSRWCNGFEVTMLYEAAPPLPLSNEEIARLYVAHFTRGDAERIARLFSESGAFLESFTVTRSGEPYRHEGREAIEAWHRAAFTGVPWRAMRILAFEPGSTEQQFSIRWEYMDPRLGEPLKGKILFTIATGEIFEARFELDTQARLAEVRGN